MGNIAFNWENIGISSARAINIGMEGLFALCVGF
jgi:hypothetical protein